MIKDKGYTIGYLWPRLYHYNLSNLINDGILRISVDDTNDENNIGNGYDDKLSFPQSSLVITITINQVT